MESQASVALAILLPRACKSTVCQEHEKMRESAKVLTDFGQSKGDQKLLADS